MLSTTLLTRLRAQHAAQLPQTATIRTRSAEVTETGGEGEPEWMESAPVRCRLLRKSGREESEGGRQVARSDWLIRLPWGTEISTENQLSINGTVYEVLATDAARSDALTLNCECKRSGQ